MTYKKGDILRRSSSYEDMYLILRVDVRDDSYQLKRLNSKYKTSITFSSSRENIEKNLEFVPPVIKLLIEL